MKTVAVVGFAESSLVFAKDSKADEMWSVNFAWDYGVPRIDRLFEIHPIEVLVYNANLGKRDKKHLDWLQQEHDFTIYTYADYTGEHILDGVIDSPPRIPNSVPYPFEKLDGIFENLHRQNRPTQIYMPSTVSYMLAMAIFEGFERIEMYGIEMAGSTEYMYQKAGTEALLMYAMGKGIEIYFPEHCKLMNIKPYHKGLQMITRQTLEAHVTEYEQRRVNALTQNNFFRGQLAEAEKKSATEIAALTKDAAAEKDIKKKNALEKQLKQLKKACEGEIMGLVKHASDAQGLAFIADAAVQTCNNLIASIDYDDPIVELVNRFTVNDAVPRKEKV